MNEKLKQIAIKAKEFGFKARTVTTIHTEKYLLGGKNVMLNDMCFYLYLCDLQEWLRSKYKFYLIVDLPNYANKYDFHGFNEYIEIGFEPFRFNTYQEALQEGIKESLKLIKNE